MAQELQKGDYLYPLIEDVCEMANHTPPTKDEVDRDTTKQVTNVLTAVLGKLKPKVYYQSFCSIWQCYEYHVLSGMNEKDLDEYIAYIVGQLTTHATAMPNLCAMCLSYIMNSLSQHPLAEASAIRLLLEFATKSEIYRDEGFVNWILQFVERRIDKMVSIEEKRDLFIFVCIRFFKTIPAELYSPACVKCCLRFLSTSKFKNRIKDKKGITPANLPLWEEMQTNLPVIATNILNTALTVNGEFFLLEMMNSTNIMKYLSEEQTNLVNIFINGNVDDFEKFKETSTCISHLNEETLLFKIQALTLISLCEGKKTITAAELISALKLKGVLDLRKFIVKINQTDLAKLKMNGVADEVIIEYSQPRQFGKDTWKMMADKLDNLKASIH